MSSIVLLLVEYDCFPSWVGFSRVARSAVMDAGSSGRVAVPKSRLAVLLSLGLKPKDPPLPENSGCEDWGLGLKVKGFDSADTAPVDVAVVAGDARRAFAFALKRSPNELEVGPSKSIGPVASAARDTEVSSGACRVSFELAVFELDTGAAENEKPG